MKYPNSGLGAFLDISVESSSSYRITAKQVMKGLVPKANCGAASE